eukprot:8453220-Lingulodinium_polyedra.AAC.1
MVDVARLAGKGGVESVLPFSFCPAAGVAPDFWAPPRVIWRHRQVVPGLCRHRRGGRIGAARPRSVV